MDSEEWKSNFKRLKTVKDLEKFYSATTGMVPGFIQLSKGLINLKTETLVLDGLTIIWVRSEGRQLWQDVMSERGLHFGFVIESAGPVSVMGTDINANEAQVWINGQQVDYVLEGPIFSLDIGVVDWLVEELGWSFRGNALRSVPQPLLDQLVKTCRSATRSAVRNNITEKNRANHYRQSFWRDRILDGLEDALQPWLDDRSSEYLRRIEGTKEYQIVKNAEDFFEQMDKSVPVRVDELSNFLGVPRRTVFRAFRKSLGLGPRKYFELKRLYEFRALLRKYSDQETTVTKLANDVGFRELGRLAGIYKTHFGENPVATLRRF